MRRLDRRRVPRSLFEGTISRKHYISWGMQTYLYVLETRPTLLKSGRRLARMGGNHARIVELLLTKSDEERGHDWWVMSDLIALGCSRAEVQQAKPRAAVQAYTSYYRFQAAQGSPYAVLGNGLLIEFVSEQRASRAAANLIARSKIPGIEHAISFIGLHGHLDGGHVDAALEFLRGITCPKARDAILSGARFTASLQDVQPLHQWKQRPGQHCSG